MARRAGHTPGWFLAALGIAAALAYATFVGSLLNSCGAGNHGPDAGAEEDFCGYGSGEPTDFSTLFLFVNLVVPVFQSSSVACCRFSAIRDSSSRPVWRWASSPQG